MLRVFLAALLAATALAGCSGGGDADTDSYGGASDDSTLGVSGSLSGSNQTGPYASGDGEPRNQTRNEPTWTYDNRSGTVSGNGAVVNVPFTADEDFTVLNGTDQLVLDLSVEGDDVTLSVRAPGCDDDTCATEATTSGGQASLTFDAPMEGPWTAQVQLDGAGPLQAEYTLGIAMSRTEGVQ